MGIYKFVWPLALLPTIQKGFDLPYEDTLRMIAFFTSWMLFALLKFIYTHYKIKRDYIALVVVLQQAFFTILPSTQYDEYQFNPMILISIVQPFILQQVLVNKWWLNSFNMLVSVGSYVFAMKYKYGDDVPDELVERCFDCIFLFSWTNHSSFYEYFGQCYRCLRRDFFEGSGDWRT